MIRRTKENPGRARKSAAEGICTRLRVMVPTVEDPWTRAYFLARAVEISQMVGVDVDDGLGLNSTQLKELEAVLGHGAEIGDSSFGEAA